MPVTTHHEHDQLRRRARRRRRRAVRTSTRTAGPPSTATPPGAKLMPARADRRLHAQRQRLRCADLRVERRERVPRVGRRGGILHDHLPRAIRGRLAHRIGARRTAAHRHRRAPGDAALRPGRPDEEPLHGSARHRPVGRLDLQRVGRDPARRLRRQRLRAAGVDRAHLLARRRLPACRTAWARAAPTISSGTADCSSRTKAIRRTAQFNDPLRNWTSDATETVHYFSIYATPPRIGRNTEVRFSYDFSHAGRQ